MSEQREVEAANRAFYQAFETLDIQEMEKVWLRAPHIKCIHPGWPLLAGGDQLWRVGSVSLKIPLLCASR